MNGRQKLALSTAISLVTVILIIHFTIDREALEYLFNRDLLWVITLIVCLHTLGFFSTAVRMKVMAASMEKKVSFSTALEAGLSSAFMAAITPSQVGGEPLRISILSRDRMEMGAASALVFGERVLDILFFILVIPTLTLIFGVSIFTANPIFIFGFIFILGIVFLVLYLGVFRPEMLKRTFRWFGKKMKKWGKKGVSENIMRVERNIDEFENSFRKMLKKGPYFIASLTLTSITWILNLAIPSVILIGFGLDPMWIYSISAQILILLIGTMPLTPGSAGITEISMLALYKSVPANLIGVFILLWRLSTYYYDLIVGGVVSINVLKKYGESKET